MKHASAAEHVLDGIMARFRTTSEDLEKIASPQGLRAVEFRLEVTIVHHGQRLGFVFEAATLRVTKIHSGGLVAKHNEVNPSNAIRIDDRVAEVNAIPVTSPEQYYQVIEGSQSAVLALVRKEVPPLDDDEVRCLIDLPKAKEDVKTLRHRYQAMAKQHQDLRQDLDNLKSEHDVSAPDPDLLAEIAALRLRLVAEITRQKAAEDARIEATATGETAAPQQEDWPSADEW